MDRRARLLAAVFCGSAVAGVTMLGCRDATPPAGQRSPGEVEPRAGQYVVAEFSYRKTCAEPEFTLSTHTATIRSATFDLTQEGDHLGTVALTGTLQVASPTPGAADIVVFAGPDTGRYGISDDTLRLWFPKEVNQWVGVLRFARYQAGQLAGSSRTNCSSLSLRLEKQP